MSKFSRDKGKRGERELAVWLRDKGIEARRGRQYKGTDDSPDVIADLPGFHIECKRVERFNAYEALEQAETEHAEDDVPVVFHKRNRKDWIIVMYAEDFIRQLGLRSPQED